MGIRYFAEHNGQTVQFATVDYRTPTATFGYIDGQWVPVTRKIAFKSNPSRHECDTRCLSATGRTMQCECSCGGKNHGLGAFNCTAGAA